MEYLSSISLVKKIVKSKVDSNLYSNVIVSIFLPSRQFENVDSNKHIIKTFAFKKEQLDNIIQLFGYGMSEELLDYIVFNFSNSDEVDITYASKKLSERFSWYEKSESGIEVFFDLIKCRDYNNDSIRLNNTCEQKKMKFLALLKLLDEVKLLQKHIPTILEILQEPYESVEWDSIYGYNPSLTIKSK